MSAYPRGTMAARVQCSDVVTRLALLFIVVLVQCQHSAAAGTSLRRPQAGVSLLASVRLACSPSAAHHPYRVRCRLHDGV